MGGLRLFPFAAAHRKTPCFAYSTKEAKEIVHKVPRVLQIIKRSSICRQLFIVALREQDVLVSGDNWM